MEATKPQIYNILKRLYEDLVTSGETFINLDESNVLTAKIFEAPKEPISIFDYNVPVLRYGRISQLNIPWDISLNYLLSRIDGISHIKKIAARKPPIDIECVKRCLRTLLFYDCVIISDAIQFTNVYQLSKSAQLIISDTVIMTGIQSFCTVDSQNPPSLVNIIKILLKFRPGRQLSQILLSAGVDLLSGMDIRRLITIAQDYKLITRLHEYPVYMFKHMQDINSNLISNLNTNLNTNLNLNLNSSHDISNQSEQEHKNNPKNPLIEKDTNSSHFSAHTGNSVNTLNKDQINTIKNKRINRRSQTTSSNQYDSVCDVIYPDITSVLCNLKGDACLDSICCTYGIAPSEILGSQMYHIIYK